MAPPFACTFSLLPRHSQFYGINLKRDKGLILIDDFMVEADWEEAEVAGNFQQFFPADTSLTKAGTKVRMMKHDEFIYIFAPMLSEGR